MKHLTKARKQELREWIKRQVCKSKDIKAQQNFATLYELIKEYEECKLTFNELDKYYKKWFNLNNIQYRAITNRKKGKLIKLRKGEYHAK